MELLQSAPACLEFCTFLDPNKTKQTTWLLVIMQAIPTELPQLIGEVIDDFCG
jgi:hypothetical protein